MRRWNRFPSCRPLQLPVVLALVVAISVSSHSSPAAPAEPAVPARTDNAVIHVEVHGHGRPIVFLPGLTCSGAVWDGAVARYADRNECHVVTLGGFAGEPRFEGPFLATARDSLLAYVDARDLDHPVLVGHSLGGVLAMQMAIARPGGFAGVVVMDALPFLGGSGDSTATESSARAAMAPLRDMIRGETREQYQAFERTSPYLASLVTDPGDLARVRRWGADSDPASMADAFYEVGTTDLREAIAGLRVPVLVLGTWYGVRDMTTRDRVDSLFRRQYARAPQVQIALADSARHFLMLDAPGWTYGRVDAFLAALAPAGGRKGRR